MNVKTISLIIALLLVTASAPAAPHREITINLHKEATVENENLTLGQVADITGDEALAAKAGRIGLGKISIPGQKITVERSVILSRLACSPDFIGIAEFSPVLTGAQAVVVTRKAQPSPDINEPPNTRPEPRQKSKRAKPARLDSPSSARRAKPEVIVERNQTVVIKIERPGLVVTATGRTMQPGAAGEHIKVRNVDSQRVITAKVNKDGTVEPVI